MGRTLGRIWVTGTTLLIGFIGYTSQIWIVWPSFDYRLSREATELLVPFNFLLLLLYYNYALCVLKDPGRAPKAWTPSVQDEKARGVEVKKLTGTPRYCRTCKAYKPPRAHHCRQCNACILKMDHHCPWVNNCVGHANYAHFIRFLFLVDVSCVYHLWMITSRAFGTQAFSRYPTTTQMIILAANYVACVPVIIAVGVFSLYHFWALAANTTTIESWEKDKVTTLRRKGKIMEFRYPYHLGYIQNIKSVLGNNPLKWCWPGQSPVGDGLHYQVATGVDPLTQYDWPPQDPSRALRNEQRRSRRIVHEGTSPFTYGTGLNPDLVASTSLRSRSGRFTVSSVAPYHPDYEEDLAGDGESEFYDDDDDDVPLSRLSNGNGTTFRRPSVRVRRGSEGYEIRPTTARFDVMAEGPQSAQADTAFVDAGNDGVSERNLRDRAWQVNEPGRYNVYLPESTNDSDSDSDTELETDTSE